MLSKIPIKVEKIKPEDINKEIRRTALRAERDTINLYKEMTALTNNKEIKTVLLDVAQEDPEHLEEFQTLLLMFDNEQVKELENGIAEVTELFRKNK